MKLFTRLNITLALLVCIAFLFRAYLHLFIISRWIPADEIINWVAVRSLVETGQPVDASYFPHGMHYLIYGIWTLTKIDPQTLSLMFNPIIGAVTVIPFFLLTRRFVNQHNALLSTLVFAVSEAHLYRTGHFGSSEGLGILLVTTCFYFFVTKRYLPSLVTFALTYQVHLLPFFFGFGTLGIYVLLKRASLKVFLSLIAISIGIIGLFYTDLFPYQRQLEFLRPERFVERVKIENVFLYPGQELFMYGTMFLGSILVAVTAIFTFRRAHLFARTWILTSALMAAILLFTYTGLTIGPYRMIVYLSMGFTLLYAALKFYGKTVLTIGVVALMFLSPTYLGGADRMFRYNDAVTTGEIQAIEWIANTYPSLRSDLTGFVADYPVIEYFNLYLLPEKAMSLDFNGTIHKETVNDRKDFLEGVDVQNRIFNFIFLSERMHKQAFFEEWGNVRTYQYRKAIPDRWADSEEWQNIYSMDGVKIYKRAD